MKRSILALYILLGIIGFIFIPGVNAAGTFSISPSSGNYLKSCNQSVDIVINVTSGNSNAADAIITYDITKIEIIDALPSVPGTQILPGNAFDSYAGNTVNTLTGEIKLVGYSSSGTLQNSATFASILFKSKPLATNGAFNFTFVGANPYNTLDSNIADSTTSFDMLTSVSNASYTFVNGSCATDVTPPTISFISPLNLATNVSPSATVTIKVKDSGIGISLPTLQIVINGTTYTALSPGVSITGTPSSYTITIIPSSPFPTNSLSVISVIVSDAAGNTKTDNISVNSGFSCPVTYITRPGSCPTVPLTPTATPDRQSPTITVVSSTAIDLRNVFPLVINTKDNNGISPESFVLTIGSKTFTLSGTPDRIRVDGSRNDYTFYIDLRPEEMAITADGKIIGTIKVSNLVGNSRIQQLIFSASGKPTGSTTSSSTSSFLNTIARLVILYLLPLFSFIYFSLYGILSTQPTVAEISDKEGKPVRSPRGYFLYSNGMRQKLFGTVNGKLHGKLPQEVVSLVIQKYGFSSTTIVITPNVKHEVKHIRLPQL